MKFIVLIYNDPALLGQVPVQSFNETMRGCLSHADEMKRSGSLRQTEILEQPQTARTVRVRNGKRTVMDGPFAETKEVLGGFNIIEAETLDEAVRLACEFPWASLGSIEVRPIREMSAVRQAVGLSAT